MTHSTLPAALPAALPADLSGHPSRGREPFLVAPADLLPLIGHPDCPSLVDICLPEDFAADPVLIPGAFRHDHRDLPGLAHRLSERAAVIVCQKGRKLSQGAAAWLRSEGLSAGALQGGMHGWRALPGSMCLPAAALPAPVDGRTLWVLPDPPDPDALACFWLLNRFIDPRARALLVAAAEIPGVAERFGASPVGIAGHRFADLLTRFDLTPPALRRMEEALTGAGPEAPGIRALLHTLRDRPDDAARRAAALALGDALYHWAQSTRERAA